MGLCSKDMRGMYAVNHTVIHTVIQSLIHSFIYTKVSKYGAICDELIDEMLLRG